jgi:hypothetical protein
MLDLPITLTSTVLAPARLCTITRLDGEVIRIAEANEPITVIDEALTYFPLAGFQLSAGKWTVGGEAASMQIDAAMSIGGTFDLYEVVDGFFDSAAVEVHLVDRANPATKGLVFSGRIEPVSFGALHNEVSFDVRGHAVKAKWPFSWTFGPMCRTELGSKLCRIPLRPPPVARNRIYVTQATSDGWGYIDIRVSSNNTDDPETFEDVYFECTTAGTSHASIQPTYDFTVGNTTTDGTAVFTCRNAWTRYAKVAAVTSEFNFTLDRDPDPRAVDGWFNMGGFRMYDGYSASRSFQIGNWVESTRTITTYKPLGAANNSTLIAAGDALEIWRGCDFTIATCAGVFANSLNFRGEPYFAGAAAAAQQN